ncbi:PREDICTED: coiled-coil domain-containing protein 22 [Nicrophorus vespilloides]|uniref:Coiled-coil domain-containing protein 22 homolog n=1 Tax=Nicrophorus vespilloides TaxID=110193 RepID=A0ABM1MHL7_NICVS|nr:PREDICTED: coiled-coil domain-containing protein 22 [Nicrophorus vespilloides]
MEEVDKIIIDSLRNLNCEIDEEITSLKGFTLDTIINSIVCCLEAIKPGLNLPKRMPTSMSLRLKLSSQLVELIQSIGFRGDLGYQSILYSNEIEIRRALMFLIERVPRENAKVAEIKVIGYIPKLVKDIKENLKLSLEQPWLPPNFILNGAQVYDTTYFQQGLCYSVPLKSENIQIPNTAENVTEELKQYWVHHLPDVSRQCEASNLLASLLFKDNNFDINTKDFVTPNSDLSILPLENITEEVTINKVEKCIVIDDSLEKKINAEVEIIEREKLKYLAMKEDVKKLEKQLKQLQTLKRTEEDNLKEITAKINIKTKTMTVLSKEENMLKLKNLVANGNDRLLELANQWNDVQSPLIEQYRSMKSSLSEHEIKAKEEKTKLETLREKTRCMQQELIEKSNLEFSLKHEVEKLGNFNTRSSYTRRILEIIGNIKKQDGEIGKILKDTRRVQKEINQLTGQLERSFTLSDALIFKDAKYDEVSRKAYKLLATLHINCDGIIQTVNDLGFIERESRNLQDQIDAELDKDMATKLERVNADIVELRKETKLKD